MLSDELPPCPGTYTLLIRVVRPISVQVGRLGSHIFPPGLYTYTGSALGTTGITLRTRIARHLAERKTLHWHIDHLLTSPHARVVAVVYVAHPSRLECAVVQTSQPRTHGQIVVDGFGSSDCRRGCQTHLHHCVDTDLPALVRQVSAAYRRCVASRKEPIQIRMIPTSDGR
jgi:Uri superfamily endonuclease